MAAPTGAPRRRSVHPGMHAARQGSQPHGASAPSAGVCHRCALIAQVPAPRSAAERWHRRDEGAPWHAPQRGRSRAAAARLCRDGGKRQSDRLPRRRPIPPFCVTTATPIQRQRHRRTAQPSACLIPSRFSYALGIATKSPLCIHTSPHFSAVFRGRSRGVRASPSSTISSGLSALRARLRRGYVDIPARIGTGSPTPACTSSAGPIRLLRARSVAVPMPVLSVAVPRVLPGFSGSSQVHLSRM